MTPELSAGLFPVPGIGGTMAAELEAAGWDGVFLTDTQNLTAEVYASLGVVAASTERVLLGTSVTNPVTRPSPPRRSPRCMPRRVGERCSGSGVVTRRSGSSGRKPAPVAVLEEYLVRVRGYLHGEDVDLGDAVSHNVWIAETGLPPSRSTSCRASTARSPGISPRACGRWRPTCSRLFADNDEIALGVALDSC